MKVIVTGAAGRMGQHVCSLEGLTVAAKVDPMLEIKSISECGSTDAEGIIDFSHHTAASEICDYAVENRLPVVFATTGQTPEELAYIDKAAKSVPIFLSANMSLGVATLCSLAKQAAAAFPDADIEIVECHHNRKLDAPSGTALMIANEIAAQREDAEFVYGRRGQAKREKNEIGIHALRMGNIIGEHSVIISTDTQRLTLKHEAMDRKLFAEGAYCALQFIAGREPGLYNMTDMVKK